MNRGRASGRVHFSRGWNRASVRRISQVMVLRGGTRVNHCAALPALKRADLRRTFLRVPAPKKPDDRQFKVGDRVTVSLSSSRVVDAIVKAIVNHADGVRSQVDYGRDETALVYLWQVRRADS